MRLLISIWYCCNGAIVRDFNEKFITASCKKLNFLTDYVMAEVYSLRDGTLAQHFGCKNFIIQSDNV
jgi:hypothetical protein